MAIYILIHDRCKGFHHKASCNSLLSVLLAIKFHSFIACLICDYFSHLLQFYDLMCKLQSSRHRGKQITCIGENKSADQLCSNCTADQHLCFRYWDSIIPPPPIPKISSFWLASVTVQAGLCQTWSDAQIVGFLM